MIYVGKIAHMWECHRNNTHAVCTWRKATRHQKTSLWAPDTTRATGSVVRQQAMFNISSIVTHNDYSRQVKLVRCVVGLLIWSVEHSTYSLSVLSPLSAILNMDITTWFLDICLRPSLKIMTYWACFADIIQNTALGATTTKDEVKSIKRNLTCKIYIISQAFTCMPQWWIHPWVKVLGASYWSNWIGEMAYFTPELRNPVKSTWNVKAASAVVGKSVVSCEAELPCSAEDFTDVSLDWAIVAC